MAIGSALVTLDGTATGIALPAIGVTLDASMGHLQWICTAPMLALIAGLLACFSLACAFAGSVTQLVTARVGIGIAGALILPSALALVAGAFDDDARRARGFGTLAAWTGAAGILGPLLAGALADYGSWRTIFVVPAAVVAMALALTARIKERHDGRVQSRKPGLPAGTASPFLRAMLQRNCVAANASTFALFFGMFAISFLVVLYLQRTLRYSSLGAATLLLPMSAALAFSKPLSVFTARWGSRMATLIGLATASAALWWIAIRAGSAPISVFGVGSLCYGVGMALALPALSNAAVTGPPGSHAGAASAINHMIVRAGGVVSVALLGALAATEQHRIPEATFQQALQTAAVIVTAVGLGSASWLRDREAGGMTAAR